MELPMRAVQPESSPAAPLCAEHPSLHVLVVDDTEPVRLVTAAMLKELGCVVSLAASGQEALDKVEDEHFDLILMDCQMPRMDGLETTRRLIARYPDRALQVVAITAHTTPRDEQMSAAAGMKAHIKKPYGMEQLRALLLRFAHAKQR